MEAAAVQTAGGGAAGGDGGALNALRQVSQEHLRPVMLGGQRAASASASTTSDPMTLQVFRLSKLSKSQTEAQVWITVTLKATETTRVT